MAFLAILQQYHSFCPASLAGLGDKWSSFGGLALPPSDLGMEERRGEAQAEGSLLNLGLHHLQGEGAQG